MDCPAPPIARLQENVGALLSGVEVAAEVDMSDGAFLSRLVEYERRLIVVVGDKVRVLEF